MASSGMVSSFLLVLVFILTSIGPSIGQMTDQMTTSPTTMIPPQQPVLTTTTVSISPTPIPNSPTTRPSSSSKPLPLEAIIGIAVGGAVLMICAAMFCLCLCICCFRRRTRRNKKFDRVATEKEPLESNSSLYRTLTPPEVGSDLAKEGSPPKVEEFEMRVNLAHSVEEVDNVSPEHNIKPMKLFGVKKSASSHLVHETLSGEGQRSTSESNVAPNTQQPPELKGYVQMSSAGSVRPSRSVDDIANLEEQDLGIYVEPGRSGAAILIQAESYVDAPPTAPKLHPKTPSLSAMIAAENSATTSRHEPTLPPTQEQGGGEYVAPDVFKIDRQTQEEIDSYYNRDTIESIRQGRGLTNVIDPSDALYTSVNSSSSTPSHLHNTDDDQLDSREEFLRGSGSKLSTADSAVHVVVGGAEQVVGGAEQDAGEEGYYNIKRHSGEEDNYDYYNNVQGIGASSNQPLLDPDDNQYVYIEKTDITRPPSSSSPAATGGAEKPAVAVKPRHLTSPDTRPQKYVNLSPSQRQILQEKAKPTTKPSKYEATHITMSNGNAGNVDETSDIYDSPDQPLYENLREEEEEEDEGGKEIYENIMS